MSQKDDALHIPIEIKTDDLNEIKDLINEITQAESDLTRIKGGSQSQSFSGQSRAASGMKTTTEGRGGIFESSMQQDTVPMNLRDRSSKQPHTRENAFNALQDQVNDMQQQAGEDAASMIDQAMGMAGSYAPFHIYNKIGGPIQNKIRNQIKQNFGTATPIGQTKLPATGGRIGGIMARLAPVLAMAGPIGAVVGAAISAVFVTKAITDWLQGPGGFWDIRYKRKIGQEMDPFLERKSKQEINIGLRTIRVTSSPAIRSANQVFSTQQAVKKGIPIYNGEFESYSKGLYI
tara:strand:+ start:73 stop:942 length:870 start_codon:yes stop_codon:yes gene_type:complete